MNNTDIKVINEVYEYCTNNNINITGINHDSDTIYKINPDTSIARYIFYVDKFSDDIVKFVNKMYKEYNVLIDINIDMNGWDKLYNETTNKIKSLISSNTRHMSMSRGYWKRSIDEFTNEYYFVFVPNELFYYKVPINDKEAYDNCIEELYQNNIIVTIEKLF